MLSPDGWHASFPDPHRWPSRKTASSRRKSPVSIVFEVPSCLALGGFAKGVTAIVVTALVLLVSTPGTPSTDQTSGLRMAPCRKQKASRESKLTIGFWLE